MVGKKESTSNSYEGRNLIFLARTNKYVLKNLIRNGGVFFSSNVFERIFKQNYSFLVIYISTTNYGTNQYKSKRKTHIKMFEIHCLSYNLSLHNYISFCIFLQIRETKRFAGIICMKTNFSSQQLQPQFPPLVVF